MRFSFVALLILVSSSLAQAEPSAAQDVGKTVVQAHEQTPHRSVDERCRDAKPIKIVTPRDGDIYTRPHIGGYTLPVYVTLEGHDYTGVTISAVGAEHVPGLFCAGGKESYMICQRYGGQAVDDVCQNQTVVFRASRCGYQDTAIVTFTK